MTIEPLATQMATKVAAPREEAKKVLVEEETKEVVDQGGEAEVSGDVDAKVVEKSASYREESNFLSDLKEFERKALNELRSKLEDAILGNLLFEKPKRRPRRRTGRKRPAMKTPRWKSPRRPRRRRAVRRRSRRRRKKRKRENVLKKRTGRSLSGKSRSFRAKVQRRPMWSC